MRDSRHAAEKARVSQAMRSASRSTSSIRNRVLPRERRWPGRSAARPIARDRGPGSSFSNTSNRGERSGRLRSGPRPREGFPSAQTGIRPDPRGRSSYKPAGQLPTQIPARSRRGESHERNALPDAPAPTLRSRTHSLLGVSQATSASPLFIASIAKCGGGHRPRSRRERLQPETESLPEIGYPGVSLLI